jgi:hypothetical protein
MNAKQILAELKPLGSDSYKKVMSRYGVKEPFFGVKISDLKKIQKRIKKDYQLRSTSTTPVITTRCTWPD